MRKFRVALAGYASATVLVELDDAEVAEVTAELREEHNADGIDDEDGFQATLTDRLRERVADRAYEQGVPGLCAQCAGWGQRDSLELGDQWEPGTVWDPELKRERELRPDEYITEEIGR